LRGVPSLAVPAFPLAKNTSPWTARSLPSAPPSTSAFACRAHGWVMNENMWLRTPAFRTAATNSSACPSVGASDLSR
jgi:hypothetical protein